MCEKIRSKETFTDFIECIIKNSNYVQIHDDHESIFEPLNQSNAAGNINIDNDIEFCGNQAAFRETTAIKNENQCEQSEMFNDFITNLKQEEETSRNINENIRKTVKANDNNLLERILDSAPRNMPIASGVLHISAAIGNEKIVKLLLDHGAEVNEKFNGLTPLLLASSNNHSLVAKLLLQFGADVNAQNQDGRSSLLMAVRNEHSELVSLLLSHKANMEIVCRRGLTCLSFICAKGNLDIIEMLLQNGAVVNPPQIKRKEKTMDDLQEAPLQFAIQYIHEFLPANDAENRLKQVITKLLKYGAAVNTANNGSLPLVTAASKGYVSVVNLLLQHGADVNLCLDDGNSAFLRCMVILKW